MKQKNLARVFRMVREIEATLGKEHIETLMTGSQVQFGAWHPQKNYDSKTWEVMYNKYVLRQLVKEHRKMEHLLVRHEREDICANEPSKVSIQSENYSTCPLIKVTRDENNCLYAHGIVNKGGGLVYKCHKWD